MLQSEDRIIDESYHQIQVLKLVFHKPNNIPSVILEGTLEAEGEDTGQGQV